MSNCHQVYIPELPIRISVQDWINEPLCAKKFRLFSNKFNLLPYESQTPASRNRFYKKLARIIHPDKHNEDKKCWELAFKEAERCKDTVPIWPPIESTSESEQQRQEIEKILKVPASERKANLQKLFGMVSSGLPKKSRHKSCVSPTPRSTSISSCLSIFSPSAVSTSSHRISFTSTPNHFKESKF